MEDNNDYVVYNHYNNANKFWRTPLWIIITTHKN